MCAPFSVHDDNLLDAEAQATIEALIAAERKRLTIALLIAGGATRYAFPHHDADAAISSAVARVGETRFKLDRLIASRAMGEPCRVAPTTGTQCLALQKRVTENEARSNVLALGPTIAATRQIDEAERNQILATHGAPVRVPSPDDFQSGFHSPMAG